MNPILRNILAVLAGILLGGAINSSIISLGPSIISLPDGVDPNDFESIKANIHLYKPIHFLVPFLAHALGTLVGALTTAFIAVSRKMTLALVIGGVFLIGGIIMVMMLPAPMWFNIVDLGIAYFPTAWIGGKIVSKAR